MKRGADEAEVPLFKKQEASSIIITIALDSSFLLDSFEMYVFLSVGIMFVIVLLYLPAVELLYTLQLFATPGQITDVVKGGFSA